MVRENHKERASCVDEIVAGAEAVDDRVRLVAAEIDKEGAEFLRHEDSSIDFKAKKLKRIADIVADAKKRPDLLKGLMAEYRGRIRTASRTGTLRADERQDLIVLILRASFVPSRATAWRYARLINYLLGLPSIGKPEWAAAIKAQGGLGECMDKADHHAAKAATNRDGAAADRNIKRVAAAASVEDLDGVNDAPARSVDRPRKVRVTADDSYFHIESDDEADTGAAFRSADAQAVGSGDLDEPSGYVENSKTISAAGAVRCVLEGRKPGYYATTTIWKISDHDCRAVAVTSDETCCNLTSETLQLSAWHGADPKSLKLCRLPTKSKSKSKSKSRSTSWSTINPEAA